MATILTVDEKEITIPKEYISHLNTIKNMVDDLGDGAIPLPITSDQMKLMETYLNIYINELPINAEDILVNKSNDELCDLLQVANHMDFSALISSITDILALRIEKLTPDEIRKIFMQEYQPVDTTLQNEVKGKLNWYNSSRPTTFDEPVNSNPESTEHSTNQDTSEDINRDPYEWMDN